MHYREFAPPPPLDQWVHCLWSLRGAPTGIQPVVPDGRLEIVIHRGEPFGEGAADGSVRRQASVLLSGQLSAPLALHTSGADADVIGIRFRTVGARALLAMPLLPLRDRVLSLDELDRRLRDRLTDAARALDPIAAISAALLAAIDMHRVDPCLREAVTWLDRGRSVAGVARTLRCSSRTLERRIANEVGLAPKLLQRVLRFRRLHAYLAAGERGSLAAARAGYADQSHANRDFRAFTGSSPRQYFLPEPSLGRELLSHSS